MEVKEAKIVFLGTPEFATPVLKKMIASGYRPFLVVTQPDKPVGRKQTLSPPPVKQLAEENGIEVAQPENKKELIELFSELKVDVCVLVAYGMIIPQEVLDKPEHGFLNIHPSKLPQYRGPSPIQAALMNGDKTTAVTIMQLTAEMDAGPILKQEEVAIKPEDTYATLAPRLSELGAELLVELLPDYLAGQLQPVEQDHSQATYCKIIKREDGLVNWSKPAKEILQQFKALTPWPGLFTHLNGKRLKINKLLILKTQPENMAEGTIFLRPDNLMAVSCGQGAVVLDRVQLEGKKETSGKDFVRGQQNIVGKVLG